MVLYIIGFCISFYYIIYFLRCLNHGACPISFNEHPSLNRMSRKMRGTGFSFFFTDNETRFTDFSRTLVSKLVYMATNGPSDESSFGKKDRFKVKFSKEGEMAGECAFMGNGTRFFTSRDHFISYMEKKNLTHVREVYMLPDKFVKMDLTDNILKGFKWWPAFFKIGINILKWH